MVLARRASAASAEYPGDLEAATDARRRGAAVTAEAFDGQAIRVARFTPRSAPVKRRRFRRGRVQVRSGCDERQACSSSRPRAATAASPPPAVLRRAELRPRSRRAPRLRARRFRARYDLRRSRARVPVRVIRAAARRARVRLRVRRC